MGSRNALLARVRVYPLYLLSLRHSVATPRPPCSNTPTPPRVGKRFRLKILSMAPPNKTRLRLIAVLVLFLMLQKPVATLCAISPVLPAEPRGDVAKMFRAGTTPDAATKNGWGEILQQCRAMEAPGDEVANIATRRYELGFQQPKHTYPSSANKNSSIKTLPEQLVSRRYAETSAHHGSDNQMVQQQRREKHEQIQRGRRRIHELADTALDAFEDALGVTTHKSKSLHATSQHHSEPRPKTCAFVGRAEALA